MERESATAGALAERAAKRRGQLLEVGYELMGELGAAGITVREVCSRSRLNPRYFYESFADLDELLVAVFDQVFAEAVVVALGAVAAAPHEQTAKVRAAIETGVLHLTDDPRRIRIVYGDAAGNPALTRRRMEAINNAAAIMTAQAVAFHGLSEDDRLARSSGQFLAGGLGQMLLAWHAGSLEVTVEELIDHATLLISGTGEAARQAAAG